jgi:UDP-glucuronate 4-epimerase
MRVLVTGAAGFIGFHLARRLIGEGCEVCGIDNLNPYYDVSLKQARLARLRRECNFTFHLLDLADGPALTDAVAEHQPDCVVNLAAQAGVRYSIENPFAYVSSNLVGFVNLLEACVRHAQVQHFVFASSSSVYGANLKVPFSVNDRVDCPISLYAATKKSNELIAHSYSHLYGLPVTGLRFFTVYGPWGRPDMGYFKFAQAIDRGKPIEIYNRGQMRRDFTYIDDVVEGIVRVMSSPPTPSIAKRSSGALTSNARYRVYNLGNHHPTDLLTFVSIIEQAIGKKAYKVFLPMQPGDVPCTYADMDDFARDFGFRPCTPIEEGLRRFVQWYREYYLETEKMAC